MKRNILYALAAVFVAIGGYAFARKTQLGSCVAYALGGFRAASADRSERFLGKVADEDTARCRGGAAAVAWRSTPWTDWQKYWAAGGDESRAQGWASHFGFLSPNQRGINGAILDLEYQRI